MLWTEFCPLLEFTCHMSAPHEMVFGCGAFGRSFRLNKVSRVKPSNGLVPCYEATLEILFLCEDTVGCIVYKCRWGSSPDTPLAASLILGPSSQNCGKINLCGLGHLLYKALLWQPSKLRHHSTYILFFVSILKHVSIITEIKIYFLKCNSFMYRNIHKIFKRDNLSKLVQMRFYYTVLKVSRA